MRSNTVLLIGSATIAVAQSTGPCESKAFEFFKHTELQVPSELVDYLPKPTPTPSIDWTNIGDEELNTICSDRVKLQTLTGLPAPLATVYSSFTSQRSAFALTAKTEASSIATLCLCEGSTALATKVLDVVLTSATDCWVDIRRAYPSTTRDCQVPSATPSASGSGSIIPTTNSTTSSATFASATLSTSTSSTPTSIPTGAAPKETGYAIAAVMAAAGVVGLL
ncbi:hypothetical protein QBC38DRAFT_492100 [Podospora fimiseda]|uniref:Infection structure specific protein n=1 Tax=Podospora fimiseda TaxID=252190 RepID=A0AAN6YS18_9PEZI|nr:hypothetical protein QBC38DRAFT_492100 [Podospora fimiseda]